ncbi:MAG: environmental stress-induced protein Ves [Bradymonadia bacterium]
MFRLNRIDQPISCWKNGGGQTRAVLAEPVGAAFESFDWRLSVASIEASGPFSVFPNIDRTLMLFRGRSLELVVGGEKHRLALPGEVLEFAGEASVFGQLHDGPVDALNIMMRRERCVADVSVVEHGTLSGVLVGLAEHSVVNGEPLAFGDVVSGVQLEVDGRVVCVQISTP